MALCRWISVGSDLKFDARRDLDDVGATCIEGCFPFEQGIYLHFLGSGVLVLLPFLMIH